MHIHGVLLAALCLVLVQVVLGSVSASNQIQAKQTFPSFLSSIGAMVPKVVSNVLPLVFMFGIGALLVPALGLTSLLREGKRRSLSTFGSEASVLMKSAQEVFDKFTQAIDRMEQKYH